MKFGKVHRVQLSQKEREKRRVALTSIIAAVFLTVMKLAVGLWTGSLGILSEAAHSGLDLVAAGITYLAVRIADKPPDREHNFGHHKIENLSALIETLLLLITCVWILYEAYQRLVHGYEHIDVNVLSFAVIGISIIIDISRSRALMKVARKYKSQALEADALHFQSDIYSSAVVIVGLISVSVGFPEGDAIAAAAVALIVIGISMRLGKRTIDVLTDKRPEGVTEEVTKHVESLNGVQSVRSVRVREAGAALFVDIVIGIERTKTFDEVHSIMDSVESEIRALHPSADCIVHAEPVIGEFEPMSESITWIVQQEGLVPHNIVILRHEGASNVHFDIEYPPETGFEEAHELASALEQKIQLLLPNISDIVIHLEEKRAGEQDAKPVTDAERDLVQCIDAVLRNDSEVHSIRDIKCYKTLRGLKIAVGCALDRTLSLRHTHDIVDRVETEIYRLDQRIVKVFIHAEPVSTDLPANGQ